MQKQQQQKRKQINCKESKTRRSHACANYAGKQPRQATMQVWMQQMFSGVDADRLIKYSYLPLFFHSSTTALLLSHLQVRSHVAKRL